MSPKRPPAWDASDLRFQRETISDWPSDSNRPSDAVWDLAVNKYSIYKGILNLFHGKCFIY